MNVEDCMYCWAFEYRKREGKHTSAQNYYCKSAEKRIYRVKICPINSALTKHFELVIK